VNSREMSIEPLQRLDVPTLEALILRGQVLPSTFTIPACYDCHGSGPLMAWRGRALCEACHVLAKMREA
jgi:hypothetical protein